MPTVLLSPAARRALERALAAARDRRHWCRLRAVLLAAEGADPPGIAHALGVSRASVYSWVAQYLAARDPDARERLAALAAASPRDFGYHTFGWTAALLARHLGAETGRPASEPTVRRALHALGFRWKRPRFVLARRDPEREGKKTRPLRARRRHA